MGHGSGHASSERRRNNHQKSPNLQLTPEFIEQFTLPPVLLSKITHKYDGPDRTELYVIRYAVDKHILWSKLVPGCGVKCLVSEFYKSNDNSSYKVIRWSGGGEGVQSKQIEYWPSPSSIINLLTHSILACPGTIEMVLLLTIELGQC